MAAQRHHRSNPLLLVGEAAGCHTRTKDKGMEEQAGRKAGRQANSRQAGGRASPSVTQEAYAEFTRPAKNCCMYIQQLRERPSLLKEVDAPMRRCVRHWKDAHPAASSVMTTSATARSSANNRQPTPPPPPNSNSSNRERAEQGRAGDGTRTISVAVRSTFCQYFEKSQAKILKIAFCSKGLLL